VTVGAEVRPWAWGRRPAGPLRIVGELVVGRELLGVLIERNLRVRVKRTVLGMFLPLSAPLLMLGIYAYVFGQVFNSPIDRYPAFIFAGLLPWTFLAQSIGVAPLALSGEADLVRRSPFPLELLPLSTVAVLFLFFSTTLGAWTAYLVATGSVHVTTLVWLIIPMVTLVEVAFTLVLLLSLVDVFNRDIRQVIGNLLTIWFFLVPVVYRRQMVPSSMRWTQVIDPMNRIIVQFRAVLYGDRAPAGGPMLLTTVTATVLLGAALTLFRHHATGLAKRL
jgi:lipopolysaccharide transport system permease protein